MNRILAVIVLCAAALAAAQTAKDREEFDYVRHTIADSPGYTPKNGLVPNATTASAIAYAIAVPIYGKKEMDRELPFRADLRSGVWTVLGTRHCDSCVGGTVIIQIDKLTGKVLHVAHSM